MSHAPHDKYTVGYAVGTPAHLDLLECRKYGARLMDVLGWLRHLSFFLSFLSITCI
jgi:hypothetical protein